MSCISCCKYHFDLENEDQRHNIQYFGCSCKRFESPSLFERWLRRCSQRLQSILTSILSVTFLNSNQLKQTFEKSLDLHLIMPLNIIHYISDKYNYEAVQMAFLPTKQRANMGFRYLWICKHSWYIVFSLSTLLLNQSAREWIHLRDYETIGEYPRWGWWTHVQTNWQNGWSKLAPNPST